MATVTQIIQRSTPLGGLFAAVGTVTGNKGGTTTTTTDTNQAAKPDVFTNIKWTLGFIFGTVLLLVGLRIYRDFR